MDPAVFLVALLIFIGIPAATVITVARLRAARPQSLPADVTARLEALEGSVQDVQHELAQAVLLTGLVLLVFLHTFRSTLIVLLTMLAARWHAAKTAPLPPAIPPGRCRSCHRRCESEPTIARRFRRRAAQRHVAVLHAHGHPGQHDEGDPAQMDMDHGRAE